MSRALRWTVPAVIAAVVAGALALGRGGGAPVSPEHAGLQGQLWVMPATQVVGFLHRHGVTAQEPARSGTLVVGRVAWTPRVGHPDERFTALLGDRHGRAGVIEQTYGPPDADVALGNGSMWDATIARTRSLAGDGAVRSGQDWTDFGQFASVPTSWGADVWFVARTVDAHAPDDGGPPLQVDDPQPVLLVALSRGDHVYWARSVATSPV